MTTYNNLYGDFVSDENIKLAVINSSVQKRNRTNVKEIYENVDNHIIEIRKYAMNFKNYKHNPIEIYDGISRKKRTIIVPKYEEQIVHHMVVNILKPIFMKGMYEHAYGSIPNRGPHLGKKVNEKWIRKNNNLVVDNVKYCLKMDIRKFFDNVSQEVLKEKLASKIKDKYFMEVLYEIIGAVPNGLPLGFYTSQWFANWYLQEFDHYVKEKLGAIYYIRYMDDMVIFDNDKNNLRRILSGIKLYLKRELKLKLKNNYQIFRFHYVENGIDKGRDLDFMGFRFYRNRTILRKTIMYKTTRKAKAISKKDKPDIHDCRQMLSYLGWISHTDTYNVYLRYIKPYVNISAMKKKIGKYDKKRLEDKKNGMDRS